MRKAREITWDLGARALSKFIVNWLVRWCRLFSLHPRRARDLSVAIKGEALKCILQ